MNKPNQLWRFINSGFQTGTENMRIDESLALSLQRGEIIPTIRMYQWRPWAISLGYNQKESDINIGLCIADGIDVVRRPTGGRAILHAHELTYSVVMYADRRSVNDVYCDISKALVCGLHTLSKEVSYEASQPNFPALYKKAESVACFASSARYEVQIYGKKLVGSAQRRFTSTDLPEVVLQHGSILLSEDHKNLVKYLSVSDNIVRKKILSDFDRKTIDLKTVTGRDVSFEEATEAVMFGFEQSWGISLRQQDEVIL
jgi:lipoyl(octanoyl) transferase